MTPLLIDADREIAESSLVGQCCIFMKLTNKPVAKNTAVAQIGPALRLAETGLDDANSKFVGDVSANVLEDIEMRVEVGN